MLSLLVVVVVVDGELHTFIKVVLVFLAGLAASRRLVELVTDAAEEATAAGARRLLARRLVLHDLFVGALALVLALAAGELVDEVHDELFWVEV